MTWTLKNSKQSCANNSVWSVRSLTIFIRKSIFINICLCYREFKVSNHNLCDCRGFFFPKVCERRLKMNIGNNIAWKSSKWPHAKNKTNKNFCLDSFPLFLLYSEIVIQNYYLICILKWLTWKQLLVCYKWFVCIIDLTKEGQIYNFFQK